ncbi:epoxyqueuosine reductase QueH [Treponema phagedenis]|uniref:epoxyqueuosine reductase QueH n=1 Tax=Treponema phagedenis TaxID=162 RepID=UPI0004639BF4|nr:epoxyqueuosine reductase QueH [Treponema phagedenis]
MKINYNILMEETIENLKTSGIVSTLLLHSCCAPCSSSVIKRLAPHFKLTVFYYNPNIDSDNEYKKRAEEQQRLIEIYNAQKLFPIPVRIITAEYSPEAFYTIAKGYENCREGGERCFRCYHLRLSITAEAAQKNGFDYFCSTLSVSPLKNAEKINKIGSALSTENCRWLSSDFKKKNGYLSSIELSKRFGLYRQDYCGCIYSKNERADFERHKRERELLQPVKTEM